MMLQEMVRVVRPGGTVAIVDEVDHPYVGCAKCTLICGPGSKWSRSKGTFARQA